MKKTIISITMTSIILYLCSCNNTANKSSITKTNNNKPEKTKIIKPTEITKAEFISKVTNYEANTEWKYLGKKPAIVDFYASWCGPCKTIAPILDELSYEYANEIVIYKIDVEKEVDLANAFGIRSIPHMLFIPKEGKPHVVNGAITKDQFKEIISKVLLKN